MSNKNLKRSMLTLFLMALVIVPMGAVADVRFEELPGQEVYNDFVVGPGKIELFMEPGETRIVEIRVSNRMGDDRYFNVDIEDFAGTGDLQQSVVLYGNNRGPYSLRDYLFPEADQLMIPHAKRGVIPVRVSIPADAEPGGRYGSVLINTVSKPGDENYSGGAVTGAAIISRIGVLFFVRVAGDVNEDSTLTSFGTERNQNLFTSGPVTFELITENKGSVHLNPYGVITIKNMAGQIIEEKVVDPWFSLPGSIRARQVEWDRPLLIGRYVAEASINRGYDDIIDTKSVVLWFIPLKLIGLILGGVLLIFLVLRFLFSRVEIKLK